MPRRFINSALRILNRHFKIAPDSIAELSENFLFKYQMKYIADRKLYFISAFILYALLGYSNHRYNISIKLLQSLGNIVPSFLYMLFYLLLDGFLSPIHWIELGIIGYYLIRIRQTAKMIEGSLVSPREFFLSSFYPLLFLMLALDVAHLSVFALGSIMSAPRGGDTRYYLTLFINPLFYLSSFLLSFVLVIISLNIFSRFRSALPTMILSAFIVYTIITGFIYFIFSIFMQNFLYRLYKFQNYYYYGLIEYTPYVLIALLIIRFWGNKTEQTFYQRLTRQEM